MTTNRFMKNTAGSCPYCLTTEFVTVGPRRPGQRNEQCSACQQYHVLNERNGTRYPITTPTDVLSEPYI